MRRVILKTLPEPERPERVPETEARHLVGVLRLRDGDRVEAIDGQGRAVVAKLRLAGADEVWLDFAETRAREEGGKVPLQLELAVLKADAMSWAIEKAVELGVSRLTPVIADHCVVKLTKGPTEFRERWQRIADQALKQCGRLERMTIEDPRPISALTAATPERPRIFCDEGAIATAPTLLERLGELRDARELSLLVGPEGGWSAGEREKISAAAATYAASLGPNVLRAETAALFAVSVAAAALRSSAGLAEFGRKS